MSGPFRDSIQAQRARVASLDHQIAELEGGFSSFFWDAVAPTLGIEAEVLEPLSDEADATEIGQCLAERENRLSTLQRLAAQSAALETEWGEPASDVPANHVVGGYTLKKPSFGTELFGWPPDGFDDAVSHLMPDAEVTIVKENSRRVVGVLEAVPLEVSFDMRTVSKNNVVSSLEARTTVSRLLGELTVKPEGFVDSLLAIVKAKQDIVVGGANFDGIFLVQGDDRTAKSVLTPEVQGHLVTMAQSAAVRLHVQEGLARLQWDESVEHTCIEAALAAIVLIHSSSPTESIRCDAGKS